MRIVLNEEDLKTALVGWITSQGVNTSGKKVEVSFTAGRGANGHTAEIDITASNEIPTGPVIRAVVSEDTQTAFTEPVEKKSIFEKAS
jgi:hypothetical protein